MKTSITARSRQRTIAALQDLAADAAAAPNLRRAATLRLSRLRAATTGSRTAKPLTVTTRTTAPAAPPAQACIEAVESFYALARQRTALFKKRRSASEHEIFLTMVALMPARVPTTDDPTAWSNFVAQVEGTLCEIKSTKLL